MTYYTDKVSTYKNGFFEREIYWDRDMLKQLGDGFLIQKIIRKTTSGTFQIPPESIDLYEHTYYEAWKIVDGCPVYDTLSCESYDDCWSYSILSDNIIAATLKDYASKYKTEGTVSMEGYVFFVPKARTCCDSIMKPFSKKVVPFAKELPSCYKCDVEAYFEPIFCHVFLHSWSFFSDDSFISDIISELDKHRLTFEECKSYLGPCFSKLPIYEKLKDAVLSSYDEK